MFLHFMGHVQVWKTKAYCTGRDNTAQPRMKFWRERCTAGSVVAVCRGRNGDSPRRRLHYHRSGGQHSSGRLEQRTPGERKLVGYLTFFFSQCVCVARLPDHAIAETLTKFLFPMRTCSEFSCPDNSKAECAANKGIMGGNYDFYDYHYLLLRLGLSYTK